MLILAKSDPGQSRDDRVGVVHRAEPMRDLLERGQLERIAKAIHKVVDDSFVTHPMRNQTQREWNRRRDLLVEAFRKMQGELNWTTDRCLSSLRLAMKVLLNGDKFTPQKNRTLWVPDQTLVTVDDPAFDEKD